MRYIIILLTIPLLLTACSKEKSPTNPAPAEGIRVITQKKVYSVGDSVHATAFNYTEDTIEVLQCCNQPILTAQVWRDTAWGFDNSLIAWCGCYGPIDMLLPPQATINCFVPMSFTEPGRYRLQMSVGNFDRSHWPTPKEYFYSNEFTVK